MLATSRWRVRPASVATIAPQRALGSASRWRLEAAASIRGGLRRHRVRRERAKLGHRAGVLRAAVVDYRRRRDSGDGHLLYRAAALDTFLADGEKPTRRSSYRSSALTTTLRWAAWARRSKAAKRSCKCVCSMQRPARHIRCKMNSICAGSTVTWYSQNNWHRHAPPRHVAGRPAEHGPVGNSDRLGRRKRSRFANRARPVIPGDDARTLLRSR